MKAFGSFVLGCVSAASLIACASARAEPASPGAVLPSAVRTETLGREATATAPAHWVRLPIEEKRALVTAARYQLAPACTVQVERVSCHNVAACSEMVIHDASGMNAYTDELAGELTLSALPDNQKHGVVPECDDAVPVDPATIKEARTVTRCTRPDLVADIAALQLVVSDKEAVLLDVALLCPTPTYPIVKPEYDRFVRSIAFNKSAKHSKR